MQAITLNFEENKVNHLRQISTGLGVTLERLLQATIEDILIEPKPEIEAALNYMMNKNDELYKRLA